MSNVEVVPVIQFYSDVSGKGLDDGFVYIGTSGLDPVTNPISVFWDEALTIPAPNPVRTRNGHPERSGAPARFFVNADSYSFAVKNKNGTTVYTALDSLSASDLERRLRTSTDPAKGAALIGYKQDSPDAVPQILLKTARENWSVRDFGATGGSDDTDAFNKAVASGERILVPAGTWNVDHIEFPSNSCLLGDGRGITTIRQINNASQHLLYIPYVSQHVEIGHLKLDGNRTNQAVARDAFHQQFGTDELPSTDVPGASLQIHDLYARFISGNAYFVGGKSVNSFRNIQAFKVLGHGMHVHCQDSGFLNLDFGEVNGHGLFLDADAYNNRFNGLKTWFTGNDDWTGSVGDGIHCMGNSNVIVGAELQENKRHGLYFNNAVGNTFVGVIETPGFLTESNPIGSTAVVFDESSANIVKATVWDRYEPHNMKYGVRFMSGTTPPSIGNIFEGSIRWQGTPPVGFADVSWADTLQQRRNLVIKSNLDNDNGVVYEGNLNIRNRATVTGEVIVDSGSSVAATKFSIKPNGNDSARLGYAQCTMNYQSASHATQPGWINIIFGDGAADSRYRIQNFNGTLFQTAYEVRGSGGNIQMGFYGATPVNKPSVTGSRGGNAALADLLTKLASLGLITDGTSA